MTDNIEIQISGTWKPGYVWVFDQWVPEDHWVCQFAMQPTSDKPLVLADLQAAVESIWNLLDGDE